MAKTQPISQLDQARSARLKRKFKEKQKAEPKMTQLSFAEDCNMTPAAVSRMLSGGLAISHEAALTFARRLGCHPGEFHDDFVDFTPHQSFELVESFHRYEGLSDDDKETVRRMIDSLALSNKKDR